MPQPVGLLYPGEGSGLPAAELPSHPPGTRLANELPGFSPDARGTNLIKQKPGSNSNASASLVEQRQISIRDLLWNTTALALWLAYARSLGDRALEQAVVTLLMVLVAGSVVGGFSGQFKNALYWSAVLALLAFLAVAGGRLPHEAVMLGWSAVGAGCGAVAGAYYGRNSTRSVMIGTLGSGLLGLVLMLSTLWVAGQPWTGLLAFDVACAAVVGWLVWPFIQFLRFFQQRAGLPLSLVAAWLTITVLLGNLLVPVLAGVAR